MEPKKQRPKKRKKTCFEDEDVIALSVAVNGEDAANGWKPKMHRYSFLEVKLTAEQEKMVIKHDACFRTL